MHQVKRTNTWWRDMGELSRGVPEPRFRKVFRPMRLRMSQRVGGIQRMGCECRKRSVREDGLKSAMTSGSGTGKRASLGSDNVRVA
jgi:hypothetical protein